jgi:gamma-glutamyltranspeptidase/glutathione hydrolase
MILRTWLVRLLYLTAGAVLSGTASPTDTTPPTAPATVDLSPAAWPPGEYSKYLSLTLHSDSRQRDPNAHPEATGEHGAIAGTTGALAVRAGLEALKQGGSAADAALTTALAQITLEGGSFVSFAGIMSMVYFDAASGTSNSINGAFNTVLDEKDPLTIPGVPDFVADPWKSVPSGRTALVPGFMAGIEAAHEQFGRLPFSSLFGPSIFIAEHGIPVNAQLAGFIQTRKPVLSRLPETKAVFTNANGEFLREGDIFRQPALAMTLRGVAQEGAKYMYEGPWAEKLVSAVRKDGGFLSMEDMKRYRAISKPALLGKYRGYTVAAPALPASSGVNTIEAFNLLEHIDFTKAKYFEQSEMLADFMRATRVVALSLLPTRSLQKEWPDLDLSDEGRMSKSTAEVVWQRMKRGEFDPGRVFMSEDAGPLMRPRKDSSTKHTSAVVVIDQWGNMATIVHSINAVIWGGTGIFVDGVSIPDAAAFQQPQILEAGPGNRIPDRMEAFLVLKDGKPALASGMVGAGGHERSMQCTVNVLDYGMTPIQAANAPFFGGFRPDGNGSFIQQVTKGMIPTAVLDGLAKHGIVAAEVDGAALLFAEGYWIGIAPGTNGGLMHASDAGVFTGYALAY